MFNIFEKLKLRAVTKVMETSQRGVFKRIDENRELLELLRERAPEFLDKHSWVEGWLESQDLFLNDLLAAVPVSKPSMPNYPRPWPAKQTDQTS